ncbi:DUF4141 domain-containing protein, partial [Microbacteriaceae bacterium K1510]|nr:DUF4141 domain-containing protein [Microbacteriaceae bacterium K1510]
MRSIFGSLILALLGAQLLTTPASAQFVCSDPSSSAQGSVATGSTENMACGPNAYADGVGVGAGSIAIGSGVSSYG